MVMENSFTWLSSKRRNAILLPSGDQLKYSLKVHVAEDPLKAVARGTAIALKNFDKFPFLIQ